MLDSLLNFLRNPPRDTSLSPSDGRIALAALLVRVARADDYYDQDEKAAILDVLKTRYDLATEAAQALQTEAEALETLAPDTVRFTRAIKDAVPYEDRRSVVQALWHVALADGQRDHMEDRLIRMVVSFLGVSDRDSALCRQKVVAQLGAWDVDT